MVIGLRGATADQEEARDKRRLEPELPGKDIMEPTIMDTRLAVAVAQVQLVTPGHIIRDTVLPEADKAAWAQYLLFLALLTIMQAAAAVLTEAPEAPEGAVTVPDEAGLVVVGATLVGAAAVAQRVAATTLEADTAAPVLLSSPTQRAQ